MSEHKRREQIGRNRLSPDAGRLHILHALPLVMLVGAWFAYGYFSEPHRVYAKKQLACDPWEVTWAVGQGVDLIRGCGRTAEVICDEETCANAEPSLP